MSPSSTSTAIESPPPANPADRLATLPLGEPKLTLGYEAIRWAHEWLVQPNGPRAKQPFRFTLDQFRFILWWYALDPLGHFIHDLGVRQLAKGSGKSPFAAVLALIEFCAPVRLERFDDRVIGGCRGKAVEMPWVQIGATAESQTTNTMRMVRAFAPKGSKVVEEFGIDVGLTKYYRVPEGTLEVITSSASAAEGAEATFVIGDQTELWKPINGGVAFAETLGDNLAKSGARMVTTPNAWEPGADSVAESHWDDWVMQEEGKLQREAQILYDARKAPADTDLSNPESLRTALEWVYGDCDWKIDPKTGKPDVRSIMNKIWRPSSKVDTSKRRYLNWPTEAEDAWTTVADWAVLVDETRTVTAEEEVVLFFDGSKSRDATAFVACTVDRDGGGHVFVPTKADGTPAIWEPDPDHDDRDTVSAEEVDETLSWLMDHLNVVAFFGDVAEWESFVKVEWPRRYRDRLRIKAVPGGKAPSPIAWDMRSHTYEFTLAAELVLAEINQSTAEHRLFTHDGNPVVGRHVVNMRRRPNRYGVSVGKETRSSSKKIDAGVCMIGSRMVRGLILAAPVEEKRSGVVV